MVAHCSGFPLPLKGSGALRPAVVALVSAREVLGFEGWVHLWVPVLSLVAAGPGSLGCRGR